MFTGIVETVSVIEHVNLKEDGMDLIIHTPHSDFQDCIIGESIAVTGVCLTVTHVFKNAFQVTVVPETLRVTHLGLLKKECLVNLERSIKAEGRFGGHYMQGHVDEVGEIIEIKKDGNEAIIVKIQISPLLSKYVVRKGYIGIDGMSITVIEAEENWFTVTFIPHTQLVTIANQYHLGTKINIEVDILSKYVEKLLGAHKNAILC